MTITTLRGSCPVHPRYLAGCTECRTYAAARRRARYRLVAYGRWEGMVDTAAARAHIASLLASGMTRRGIAAASGVARTSVYELANGSLLQAYASTVTKILAVRDHTADTAWVDSLGTSRRLQALMAIGWDAASLAVQLGVSTEQVRKWRYRYHQNVRQGLHRRIAELYRQLSDRPGPSSMARAQARHLSYAAPIHWDDDGDIDRATCKPKGIRPPAAAAAVTSRRAA